MSTDIKTRGEGLKRQRSLQLDDETFALLVNAEQRTGLSKSALIGQLIWGAYGEQPRQTQTQEHSPEAIAAARDRGVGRADEPRPDDLGVGRQPKTPLPDERATSFAVEGNKVRTKTAKTDSQLSVKPGNSTSANFDL